jgi:WD40 repeat protein
MIVISILRWWIFLYLPGIVVECLESQLEVRLVDTLCYNESGSIRSVSWRRPSYNASSYQLVAASLSQTQVWNYTHGDGVSHQWELVHLMDFFVVQPVNRSNVTAVRAVSFSPNGKWLAIGTLNVSSMMTLLFDGFI